VTDLGHYGSHLLFSLIGLYFLGKPMERHWGTARFARFLAASVVLGNVLGVAVDAALPASLQGVHPGWMFGPGAAITAIAVAWSREFGDATVNLYFLIAIRGRHLLWFTLGLCVLNVLQSASVPEGIVAPFGGVAAGLLFSGAPSMARRAWLQVRLAILRRKATSLRVEDVLTPRPERKPRPGAPPLRVVQGGLEEVLRKRNPPKDKRYLN
jgi:membrane associated rhomboid family serine protease